MGRIDRWIYFLWYRARGYLIGSLSTCKTVATIRTSYKTNKQQPTRKVCSALAVTHLYRGKTDTLLGCEILFNRYYLLNFVSLYLLKTVIKDVAIVVALGR